MATRPIRMTWRNMTLNSLRVISSRLLTTTETRMRPLSAMTGGVLLLSGADPTASQLGQQSDQSRWIRNTARQTGGE